VTDEEIPVEILKIDEAREQAQIRRLREIKKTRDNSKVRKCLDELRRASEENRNLLPYILDAVKSYATLQEICDVWRQVFGEYRDPGYF
jgi:methylmalonyl-CoA mutase N-terminal domain/subunit